MSNNSIEMLLVVEDNLGDARLFREMFNDQGSHNTKVMHVECMSEADPEERLLVIDDQNSAMASVGNGHGVRCGNVR